MLQRISVKEIPGADSLSDLLGSDASPLGSSLESSLSLSLSLSLFVCVCVVRLCVCVVQLWV